MTRNSHLQLTARDQEIVQVLCRRVRVLSLLQIVRTWWSEQTCGVDVAQERLRFLRDADLVTSRQVMARTIEPLTEPIIIWRPRLRTPDLGAAAWRLYRRWSVAPAPTMIFFATRRAARLFAGRRRGQASRAFQVSHDLGVAEIYLALRRQRPECIPLWVDEDRLAPFRRKEKLPDAVLAKGPSAIPELVLEFGAGYGKARLRDFHDDNERRGLPYEVW